MATITGTVGNDILNGTADDPANGSGTFGDDTIYGLGGDDIIDGMGGADTIDAGAGNDTVKVTVFGAVVRSEASRYDGGAGFDTLDLTALSGGVDLLTYDGLVFSNKGGNRSFSVYNFERVVFGSGNDSIDASRSSTSNSPITDVFLGAGDDSFEAGTDPNNMLARTVVHGGTGDDYIDSAVSMYGDDGNDLLCGKPDLASYYFRGGDDSVTKVRRYHSTENTDGFAAPTDGTRIIDGGRGIDIIANTFASIDLTDHVARNADGSIAAYIVGIENIVGNGNARGDAGDNVFDAFTNSAVSTADTHIRAEGGNDTVIADKISGTIDGGSGDDAVYITSPYQSSLLSVDGGIGNDTTKFDFAFKTATITTRFGTTTIDHYASSTVLNRYVVTGVEHLVFTDQTIARNDGAALFDSNFYLSKNPDVAAARVDAYSHYDTVGWKEGRDPDALFSTTGYLASNPDVARAQVDPLLQYAQYGWKEGRDPSASFDTTLYLIHNPDVAAAGADPLAHYLAFGQGEGRAAYEAIGTHLYANGFDPDFYLLANRDVAAQALKSSDPRQFAYDHYESVGWREGRDPNAWFDDKGYLAAYKDVAAAGIDPLDHYAQIGWHEGRDPSANFDTQAYLSHNADVAAAGVDPLLHYLQYGAYEQRNTFADGAFHT